MVDKVQVVEQDDGPSELYSSTPEIIPSGLLPYFGPNVSKWMLDDAISKIRHYSRTKFGSASISDDNVRGNIVSSASDYC